MTSFPSIPKDPLSNVVDLSDGDEDKGGVGRLSPFDGGAGDRKVEKKEENGAIFPRKKRRRDEDMNNFHNFVGHEIIDGEDEDDGKG